jgi:hypothetical protein
MLSYLRPSTHRRTSANTRSAGPGSVGRPPLPPPSPWEKPHGPIPRPAPLLNRLAAEPPSLSPTSIAPLAAAPTAPAISWLSEPLPPACKAGKTFLLDAFKLSSMAVLYLLGFGWGKNTSHGKWHNSALLHSESRESSSLKRLYRAAETASMDTRLARSVHQYDKHLSPSPPLPKRKKEGRG